MNCNQIAAAMATVTGILIAGPSAAADLPEDATSERPYANSLGVKFVPVPGTAILM